MVYSADTQRLLTALEYLLVQEFRTLQSLISLTKRERLEIPANQVDALMKVVEEKETVLDQLSLMEEKRRTLTQELACDLGLQIRSFALAEVLPALEPAVAAKLGRLQEGVLALVGQARDLNCGNKALASAALEWLASAQTFLLDCCAPEADYRPFSVAAHLEKAAIGEVDQRI